MLLEAGYGLEEIAKTIIKTEHDRQDRFKSIENDQRWDKLRSMLFLKPSSLFDLMREVDFKNSCSCTVKKAVSHSPSSKGFLVTLRKLRRKRSDKMPTFIICPQAA